MLLDTVLLQQPRGSLRLREEPKARTSLNHQGPIYYRISIKLWPDPSKATKPLLFFFPRLSPVQLAAPGELSAVSQAEIFGPSSDSRHNSLTDAKWKHLSPKPSFGKLCQHFAFLLNKILLRTTVICEKSECRAMFLRDV